MRLLIQHVHDKNPGKTEKEEGGQEPWPFDDDCAKVEDQHRMEGKPDATDLDLPPPEYQAFYSITNNVEGVPLRRHYLVNE